MSRYNGQGFENFSRADGLANDIVMDIAEDRSGNLWFATYGGGVSRYDGETFTTFTTDDGLAGNIVTSIVEDRSGNLWFGTYGGGISRYDGETFTNFTAQDEDGLVDDWIVSISEDSAGQLWFGTNGGGHLKLGGISRYDGEAFSNFSAEHNIYAQYVYDTMEDGEGHIWFARYPRQLTRFDGQAFTDFTTVDGLANNGITDIFEDRSGTLWLSTNGGGISRYGGARFTQFTTKEGLANSLVFAIAEGRNGAIWAGTGRGLNRYDGRTWQTFDHKDGLASDRVYSITQNDKGTLWFGNDGVSKYDQHKMVALATDSELDSLRVNAALHDHRGHLWFGTAVGVFRYDGTSVEKFTTADGLAWDNVWDIAQDSSGHLWFSTYRGGVSRYDGVSWKTFDTEDGLADNSVWSIIEDSSGNLWFGTSGGVSRYDGQTFTNFTMDDGLASNFVLSVIEDRLGNLWFGTFGGGVSHYDGQVFQTISRQDGLVSDAVQEVIEDREGQLWFATEGGITRYRPSRLKPSIEMEQVLADRSYGLEGEINLSSEQEFVIFSFRGRSFTTRSDRLVYLYRLQGLENEWQQTRQPQVQYGPLPPGKYEFQVKAVNRDLNYSEQAATVNLIVRYPYDQLALWIGFGLALVGLMATGSYAANKRRSQLQAERALLQELEDELQTARHMQMGLMPTQSPQISGLDIAGRCETVNHVGGDFFQYFEGDKKLSVCLADVTGHAMEAAVPVMMFSGILKTEIRHEAPVEQLFSTLNNTLHDSLDSRTFVCFTMGELNMTTHTLRLANGGCPYPYHYRAATGEITELEVDAYPLGVRAKMAYAAIETVIEPGDYIVFCSDGIVETANEREDLFGFERTMETIRAGCADGLSSEALIDRLIDTVQGFAGNEPQGDDMTCVVLKVATV